MIYAIRIIFLILLMILISLHVLLLVNADPPTYLHPPWVHGLDVDMDASTEANFWLWMMLLVAVLCTDLLRKSDPI